MFTPGDLFDLKQTAHASLFEGCEFAWEALKHIKAYARKHAHPAKPRTFFGAVVGDQVLVGDGTTIEPGVLIKGPAIIGANCEIRHNAYIREDVVIGDNCVVGNSCELKNSLLFNEAKVPHFSYVGDSILGYLAHLGAGVKISNFKLMATDIVIEWAGKRMDTGLRKFGALVGDKTDIGCNTVLNPGSIIGRNSIIYPNTNWRGVLDANMIVKNRGNLQTTERKT